MKTAEDRVQSLRVSDLLRALGAIRSYTHGMTRAQFNHDPKMQDAVIRQIQIIGEAAKALSPEFHAAVPADDWIAGVHAKLTCHYWKPDLNLVWDVSKSKARWLENALSRVGLRRGKSPDQLDEAIMLLVARKKSVKRSAKAGPR